MSTPSIGQEPQQTPENAQRFLALLVEKDALQVTYSDGSRYLKFRGSRITGMSPCQTLVDAHTKLAGAKPKWLERSVTDEPALLIDWSKVSRVVISPNSPVPMVDTVSIIWSTEGTKFETDSATAKRMHYAANFHMAHCDKTAETGF